MRAAALLLLGACATEAPMVGPVASTSFDVLVHDDRVVVHRTGDLVGECTPFRPFPAVGACLPVDDIVECTRTATSCITAITLDGNAQVLDLAHATSFAAQPGAQSTLRIEGCGGGAEVEIDRTGLPTPSVEATFDATSRPVARWSTDIPATSTVASVVRGYAGIDCHVADTNEHAFEVPWPTDVPPSSVAVQTFLPVETVTTPLGEVRLWRGNLAVAQFPTP